MKNKLIKRLCLLVPVALMTPTLFTSCANANEYDVIISRSNNNPLSNSNTSITLTASIFDKKNQVDISDREDVVWTCSEQTPPSYLTCDINHNTMTLILSIDTTIYEQKLFFTATYGKISKIVEVMISSYTPPNYPNTINLDKNLVSLTQSPTSKSSTVIASITGPGSSGTVTFNSADLAKLPSYVSYSISGNQLTISLVDNMDTIQGNFAIRVSLDDASAATKTVVIETENFEFWVDCIPKDYLSISGSTLNGIKSGISISQLDSFTTLKIPREITRIKNWAFGWDASVGGFNSYLSPHNINLDWGESKITTIGEYGFVVAPFRGVLTLPSSLTTLGKGSFCSVVGITSIDMSNVNKLTTVPYTCFMGCDSLSSINFANSITTIDSSAFSYCPRIAGTISLPSELTTINGAAFQLSGELGTGCTLNWNSKIRSLGDGSFSNFNLIGDLVIPSNITSLPQVVFKSTQITKATISSNIRSIGMTAFSESPQLKEFVIQSTTHFQYSANPSNPSSTLTLLYRTPIDPNNSSPSVPGAKVIVPASELSWYKSNWPTRITIEAGP